MSAVLNTEVDQPEIGTGRPWVGKVFLFLALAWFGGVFYVMRPDHPHAAPRPLPYITLADGVKHKVYLPSEVLGAEANWVEGIDIKTQYTQWDFLRRPVLRFLIIAVTPIFAALAGAFMWLGFAEWRIRRRYAGLYSSY